MQIINEETNEYRKKFHSYYYEKIRPDLEKFENLRKAEFIKYKLLLGLMVLTILITILTTFYLMQTMPMGVFISTGFYYLASDVKKKLEKKVKEAVINSFLSFFGDFSWSMDKSMSIQELQNSCLTGEITTIKGDDYFEGAYKDTKIVISENKLMRGRGRDSQEIFSGIFVNLQMKKLSNARTIIIEERPESCLNFLPTSFKGLEKVELEDTDFQKTFKVFSQNQIEARYILTTGFMERLKYLKEIFKVNDIRVSFWGYSVLIAMSCNKDMFVLGDITKPMSDTYEMQTLFEQFLSVLSIIDILNLNSKSGL